MMKKKVVWIIAGLDTSGGSGIQNDTQTIANFNVHACTLLSCIAVQNNQEVVTLFTPPRRLFEDQINALKIEFPPQAIKIGLIKSKQLIKCLCQQLDNIDVPIIADPIISTSSGYKVLEKEALNIYIKNLLPRITLLTPNLVETECLLGYTVNSQAEVEKAALKLINLGAQQVIIKGGHAHHFLSADYWTDGSDGCWLSFPKVADKKIRGTGCAFSAVLTACIALGDPVLHAFMKAKNYVYEGIQGAYCTKGSYFFLSHQLDSIQSLPQHRNNKVIATTRPFLTTGKIGFYPIVDGLAQLQQLIRLNVKTIQLRIKNADSLEETIESACMLAKKHEIKLYINDYWQLAIKWGAYGVHLGQEDLVLANLVDIQKAGLRLGISTHNHFELMAANSLQPSYIAVGPIFVTPTKPQLMPLSVDKIFEWRRLTHLPLVAIGGIRLQNVKMLIAAGINGISVISALKPGSSQEIHDWLTLWH